MSYIQIEIGGKLRGLKFNNYTVITMAQKSDMNNYQATAWYAMVYAGLKANCYVKDEAFVEKEETEINGKKQVVETPITFEQVCDWVDELKEETLLKVFEAFQETQAYKNLIDKENIEGNGHIEPEPITKKKLSETELKT